MEKPSTNPSERYATFWLEEGEAAACEQLRTTVYFVLALHLGFLALDRWAYPDQFAFFASMRAVVCSYALAILYRFRFTAARLSQFGIAFAVGAEIMAMVYASQGANSYYYTGLIIVMVGMPVLQPFRAIDAFAISSLICIGFAVSPLFIDVELDQRHYTIAMVFVLSGAIESVLSSYKLDRARLIDFEQKKELEAARDDLKTLDELKARLTSNIHHELRTPLTLILAPLQSMISGDYGPLPKRALKSLIAMENNGQRLLTVVSNLLDLAKLEGNSFKIQRREGDFVSRVREIVSGAEALAQKKGVTLGLETVGDPRSVYADWDAIDKVVLNLLGNALKFTPEGGRVDFRIDSIHNPREEGDDADRVPGVLLSVTDTGIGIEADQLDKIFDRFAQVDGSATRQHEGTGIGLALVRELVELHGGHVWAESRGAGHGTTMSAWLPVGAPDTEDAEGAGDPRDRRRSLDDSIAAAKAELHLEGAAADDERLTDVIEMGEGSVTLDAPDAETVPLEDRPKLVVADDNPDMRDLFSFILGHEFDIRVASDGEEAYQLVMECVPAAVLTDLMMPRLSGIGLLQKLRANPETESVPVILVTSKADRSMKIEGLEEGADDYVTKPFHPKELLARARAAVRVGVLQAELSGRNQVLEETLVELKRTQKHMIQNERRAAAGEIAAGIAHEVNNPVNFALNAARAMGANIEGVNELASALLDLEWENDEKLARQLGELRELVDRLEADETVAVMGELDQIIRDGLDRTRRLVADLRDLVVPGEGEFSSVDVKANVDSALRLLAQQLADRQVSVDVDIDDGIPMVKGNWNSVNQILVNLIKNASEELTPETGVIRISAAHRGEMVQILVEDNGPGVPEECAERIFEPFVTTKDPGKGTGLGLSVSRQMAESHGGHLELLPSVGAGATFCLQLPVAEDSTGTPG